MTVDIAEVNEVSEFHPNGLTRCDQCPNYCSRAYVRYVKGDKELLFCRHHSNANELALMASNWLKQDRTDVLDAEVTAYKTVNPDDDNF